MEGKENIKINPLIFVVLVVYPLFILGLGIWYGNTYGIGLFEILLFIGTYYLANISIGVGLHRCWSHGAYKLNKYVEFILAMLSAGTLQGPALVWCSDHYKHHTFTDKEGDPHSPLKYDNPFKGFFWAHMGWMLFDNDIKQIDRITLTKLGRNKILRWQMKYYWQIAVYMNAVLPPVIGYVAGGMTMHGAIAGFIFMGLARAFQQQMTFCINSFMHFVGSTPYAISTARDSWWLFPFVLGENWHNFHHAFPMDYRNGVKWYHPDIHKWIIWALEKLGLATSIIRTSDVRIKAKLEETLLQKQAMIQDNLSFVESAANYFAKAASERLVKAEKSARKQIELLQKKAQELAENVRETLSSTDNMQTALIKKYNKQLQKLENLARKYNIILQEA
jgi:stearoyl-CoA desaturase (Delta-9 desaturase)